MKILVTGGSGFIGKHLAQHLKALGNTVCITGLEDDPCPKIDKHFQKIEKEDLVGIDAIFHLAAITSTTNHSKDVSQVNYNDAIRFFTLAIKAGVKKIIYASSCSVYGNSPVPFYEKNDPQPLNEYAQSKADLDKAMIEIIWEYGFDISVIGLRYTNVYGMGEDHKGSAASMIHQMIRQIGNGEVILFKDGDQLRDWVYINDVIRANVKALNITKPGYEVFNIGSGIAVSFNHLIDICEFFLGKKAVVKYIDNPNQGYQNYTLVNLDKSKEVLGYSPAWNVLEGIKDFILQQKYSKSI